MISSLEALDLLQIILILPAKLIALDVTQQVAMVIHAQWNSGSMLNTNADDYDVPYFGSLGDHTTGTGKYFISDGTNDAEALGFLLKTYKFHRQVPYIDLRPI